MNEVWKDIPGYEGQYQASSFGRIQSLDRLISKRSRWGMCANIRVSGRVLSATANMRRSGYMYVSLYKDGTRTLGKVHRLVALAFHGLPQKDKPQAAHKDGRVNNNRPDNIYWASAKENHKDKRAHGTYYFGSRPKPCRPGGIPLDTALFMLGMREYGCTWSEIGETFNIKPNSVLYRIVRLQKYIDQHGTPDGRNPKIKEMGLK